MLGGVISMKDLDLYGEVKRMKADMDSLFSKFMKGEFGLLDKSTKKDLLVRRPLSNIWETDKQVMVELEMPGLDKKDIKVSLDGNKLHVSGKMDVEKKLDDKKKGVYSYERRANEYSMQFLIPKPVDFEHSKAEYKHGILTLTLSKVDQKLPVGKYLDVK